MPNAERVAVPILCPRVLSDERGSLSIREVEADEAAVALMLHGGSGTDRGR